MKKEKSKSIQLATPTSRSGLMPEYVLSATNALFYLTQKTKMDVKYKILTSALVVQGRNSIMEACKTDYLIMIDSDMVFENDAIEHLIKQDKDVISGVAYKKAPPFEPVVAHLTPNKQGYQFYADFPKDKAFQCEGVGGSFLLIKKKVIDAFTPEVIGRIGRPFNTKFRANGNVISEDFSFCERVRELGFEIWVDPIPNIGHIGFHLYGERDFKAYNRIQELKGEYGDKVQETIEGRNYGAPNL